MKINSFYPVLMVDNLQYEIDFFKNFFDFKETFSSDWYVSLIGPSKFELAIITKNHDTIPGPYRQKAEGLILNFEVDNVDKYYEEMGDSDIPLIKKIKTEVFGQRHFIIKSPNGVLIDIIQVTEPTDKYADNYNSL